MSWKERFNEHAQKFPETDFLQHVSKTVNGKTISSQQFLTLIESIAVALELNPQVDVLDLCCGNGVVTKQLAIRCKSVKALDFSDSLIQIAMSYNKLLNIEYKLGSVFEIKNLFPYSSSTFDCISMYEALQCFAKDDLRSILETIQPYCTPTSRVLFGSVPDADRLWNFYNTVERREEYFRRSAEGTEAIGTWWQKSDIENCAKQCGFDVQFFAQPDILHTAHYRFDVLLRPIRS